MLHTESIGLLFGAIALGAVHGMEPGHGWPIAASYALDRTHKWAYGFAASLIIGVGHLVSSIAMVAAFFYAKAYFDLTQVDEPIAVLGGVRIGGPVSLIAGVLLIALGVREYVYGHSHAGHDDDDHGHSDHDPAHSDPAHSHDHGDRGHGYDRSDHGHAKSGRGRWTRLTSIVPVGGGHSHDHRDGTADRGLLGIAWFAFVLGFAHEEEFEIIALCAGSTHCLELMSAYAVTVVAGIVGLTMLLIAGYQHFEERVEAYTPYLPAVSATVLVVMGVGFITGLL